MQQNYGYQQPSYGYQQPNYGYQNYQVPKPTNSVGLVYVNTMEEANKYIVAPNQTVLIKINDGNSILEKTTDYQGNYFIKVYERKEMSNVNSDYATKADFNTLLQKINELSERVGKANEQQ